MLYVDMRLLMFFLKLNRIDIVFVFDNKLVNMIKVDNFCRWKFYIWIFVKCYSFGNFIRNCKG